eukprot:Gb_02519 [translate_table: standard]
MHSSASSLAGCKVQGFVHYFGHGLISAWPNNRVKKDLRFSLNCSEAAGLGLASMHCLTRALHIEDKRSRKHGDKDFGSANLVAGSLLDQPICSNYSSCSDSAELAGADEARGENGILAPVTRSQSKLLQVAVDIDEVLGSFLNSLNSFIAEKYLEHYDLSEYYVYDFMKIWKCSQAEANDRVHAFFESNHFNSGILPIPGAYQSLSRLSLYCNLVVVTSRQHVIRKPSLEWISAHYRGIFREIHFGNHFALEGKAKPKSEICKSLGVQFLIDDNPRYAVECAEEGIEVFLFDLDDNYPWSKTPDGPSHPLITRVCNWQEVELKLMAHVLSAI